MRWWCLKFIEIVRKFGFKDIEEDNSFLRKVLKKVKEWEILFPQLKDNTLPTSGGVNMLFQIKNSYPQVFDLSGWFSF